MEALEHLRRGLGRKWSVEENQLLGITLLRAKDQPTPHHSNLVTSTWAYSSPHQKSTNLMSHSSYTCQHISSIGAGCPGCGGIIIPGNVKKYIWMWGKRKRFIGGLGNAGLTFGLDDPRGLFLNKELCDAMIYMFTTYVRKPRKHLRVKLFICWSLGRS